MPTTAAATTKPKAFLPFILLSSLLAECTPVRPPRSDGRCRSIHNPRPPDKPEGCTLPPTGNPHALDLRPASRLWMSKEGPGFNRRGPPRRSFWPACIRYRPTPTARLHYRPTPIDTPRGTVVYVSTPYPNFSSSN